MSADATKQQMERELDTYKKIQSGGQRALHHAWLHHEGQVEHSKWAAMLTLSMRAARALATDLQKVIQSRTQLESQQNENDEGALLELNRLGDEANVYKLIGPALIKQVGTLFCFLVTQPPCSTLLCTACTLATSCSSTSSQ